MTILSRMTQLRGLTVALGAGTEPVIEPLPDIDDCTEVYGDNVIQLFPEIRTPCRARPDEQCIYSIRYFNCRKCIHCHQWSGLER